MLASKCYESVYGAHSEVIVHGLYLHPSAMSLSMGRTLKSLYMACRLPGAFRRLSHTMAPADVAGGQGDRSSAGAHTAALSTRKPCTGLMAARPAVPCTLSLSCLTLATWMGVFAEICGSTVDSTSFKSHRYLVVGGG